MGTAGRLRGVEKELIGDVLESNFPLLQLGKKYGVSKQAISRFCQRRGVKRPKREHTENCSICQGLIGIARQKHGDFISSLTIMKQLKVGTRAFRYHIHILRKKGLISQWFGRIRSRQVELAYRIYFIKRLPVSIIGRQAGLKNFHVTIREHKALGWDVPDPLFTYDGNERRKRSKMAREKRRMQLRRAKSPG